MSDADRWFEKFRQIIDRDKLLIDALAFEMASLLRSSATPMSEMDDPYTHSGASSLGPILLNRSSTELFPTTFSESSRLLLAF